RHGPPRARRPLHLVRVADGGRGIEVALRRPPQDELPRLLLDLAELQERDVGHLVAGLLRELAQRDRRDLLALLDLALGDGPVAQVLLDPERPAHVREEHLHRATASAPQQDAGARPARLVRRHGRRSIRCGTRGGAPGTPAGPTASARRAPRRPSSPRLPGSPAAPRTRSRPAG